jgi:polar amino acid transport system substrate-binding protein
MYKFISLALLTLCLFVFAASCSRPEKKLRVIARDPSWYPLNLMGKENNLLGFTDELLYAIAKEEDLTIELVVTSDSTLLSGLDHGRYDGIITSLTPSLEYEKDHIFSEPLYLLGPVLVVPMSSTIDSLSGLENKMVGIQRGSATAFDTVRFPSVGITQYDNLLMALDMLTKRNIDAVIMKAIPAYVYTQSFFRTTLKIATTPLTSEGLRLMMNNDSDDDKFMKRFNDGLKRLKENGSYEALTKKWGIYNPL